MSLEPDGGLSSNDTTQHISTPGMTPVPHFVNHGTANIRQYNDVQKDQNNTYHYHSAGGMQDALRDVGNQITTVMGNQKNIHVEQSQLAADILRPSAVKEAAWNSFERFPADECFAGTRSQVLGDIMKWALKDSDPHKIYWVTGALGIGKSCIAQTLAQSTGSKPEGTLGASFFFSVDDNKRNDARKLIATIAFQLCCTSKYQDKRVMKALKADSSIPYQDPSTQFHKLIKGTLPDPCRRPVIIVDDFDEGGSDEALKRILLTLLDASINTPLRFIITSQLTPTIRKFLQKNSQHIHSADLDTQHEASKDIQHFLLARFGEVEYSGNDVWFTSEEVDQLVKLSGGLFLFAAAVVKHIENRRSRRPHQRLQDVLTIDINAMPEVRDRLDEFYRRILSQIPQDAYEVTHQLLATLCITSGSFLFTLSNLDVLHGLESGDTWSHLQYLHAFLYVPAENDDRSYVRLMHRFFREFILDSERSREFVIDPKVHHGYLATRCLVTLTQGLHRNLRDLPDPLEEPRKNRKTLETFLPQDQISTTIPGSVIPRIILNGALEYACRFWCQNFLSGNEHSSSEALAFLRHFCMRSVLHWVEAMSLLSCMEDALQIMQASLPVVELLDDTSVIQRINTVAKVTQECHDRIFAWPLNVYDLGLIECIHDPSDTIEASTKPLARQPASPNTSVPTTSKPSRPRDTQAGQPPTQPLDTSKPPNRLPSPPRSPAPDGNTEDQSPSPEKSLPKPPDDLTPPPADSPGNTTPPSPRVQDVDVDDVPGVPTDDGSPIPPDSESSSSSPRRGTSPSPQGAPQPHSSPNPRSKPARPIPNTEGNPSPSATPPLSTSTEPDPDATTSSSGSTSGDEDIDNVTDSPLASPVSPSPSRQRDGQPSVPPHSKEGSNAPPQPNSQGDGSSPSTFPPNPLAQPKKSRQGLDGRIPRNDSDSSSDIDSATNSPSTSPVPLPSSPTITPLQSQQTDGRPSVAPHSDESSNAPPHQRKPTNSKPNSEGKRSSPPTLPLSPLARPDGPRQDSGSPRGAPAPGGGSASDDDIGAITDSPLVSPGHPSPSRRKDGLPPVTPHPKEHPQKGSQKGSNVPPPPRPNSANQKPGSQKDDASPTLPLSPSVEPDASRPRQGPVSPLSPPAPSDGSASDDDIGTVTDSPLASPVAPPPSRQKDGQPLGTPYSEGSSNTHPAHPHPNAEEGRPSPSSLPPSPLKQQKPSPRGYKPTTPSGGSSSNDSDKSTCPPLSSSIPPQPSPISPSKSQDPSSRGDQSSDDDAPQPSESRKADPASVPQSLPFDHPIDHPASPQSSFPLRGTRGSPKDTYPVDGPRITSPISQTEKNLDAGSIDDQGTPRSGVPPRDPPQNIPLHGGAPEVKPSKRRPSHKEVTSPTKKNSISPSKATPPFSASTAPTRPSVDYPVNPSAPPQSSPSRGSHQGTAEPAINPETISPRSTPSTPDSPSKDYSILKPDVTSSRPPDPSSRPKSSPEPLTDSDERQPSHSKRIPRERVKDLRGSPVTAPVLSPISSEAPAPPRKDTRSRGAPQVAESTNRDQKPDIGPSAGSASSPPWNSKRRQPKSPANDLSNETSQEDPLTHLHPAHSERTSGQPATSLAPSPSAQSTGQTSPESPFIVSTQSSSLESSHPIGGQSVPTSNREPLPNASGNVPTSSGPVRSIAAPSATSTQSNLPAPSHRHNSRISSEITSSSIVTSSDPNTSPPSKTSSVQSSEHSSVHPSFNPSLSDIYKPLELKDGHRLSFTLQDLPPSDAGTIVHAAVNAPEHPDPVRVLFGSSAAIRSSKTVSTEEHHDLNMVSSGNKPTFHQISPLLSSERVLHSADHMSLGTSAVTTHLTQPVTPTHQTTSQPQPVGIRLVPESREGELSTSSQSSFDLSRDEVPLEHASSARLINEAAELPSPLHQTMSEYFGEALESVLPPSDEGLLAELVQPSILYRRPGGTLSIEPRQISQSTFGPGASAVLSPTTIDIAFSSPPRRLTQPQAYRQPPIRTFFDVPSISLPPEWSKLDNTGTHRIGSCSRCPRPVGDIVICQVSEDDDDDDVESAIVCEACLAENTPTPSQTFEMYFWANRRQVDQDDHIPELRAIKPVCDHCKDHIKQRGSWFHCISHRQNLNDLCTSCFESEQLSTQNEFIHCVVPVLKILAQDNTSRLPSRPSAIQRESSTTSYTTSAPPSSLPETPFDIPFSDVIGVRSPGSGLYSPRDPLAPAEGILANIQEEVSSLPVKHLDQEFSTTPQRSASNHTSGDNVTTRRANLPRLDT